MDKLSKLKGEGFDKACSSAIVKDPGKVAMVEKAEKDVQDAGVKKFAEKTLPTLKEHLELAEKL